MHHAMQHHLARFTTLSGLRPHGRQGQGERRESGGLDRHTPLIGAGLVRVHANPQVRSPFGWKHAAFLAGYKP
jgi:hypothetical protein